MEKEKKQIIKILGINENAEWADIFAEIGKLQERAQKIPPMYIPPYKEPDNPLNTNPNLHYHGTLPCYNNPCVWC
jgi:hypothetical protein